MSDYQSVRGGVSGYGSPGAAGGWQGSDVGNGGFTPVPPAPHQVSPAANTGHRGNGLTILLSLGLFAAVGVAGWLWSARTELQHAVDAKDAALVETKMALAHESEDRVRAEQALKSRSQELEAQIAALEAKVVGLKGNYNALAMAGPSSSSGGGASKAAPTPPPPPVRKAAEKRSIDDDPLAGIGGGRSGLDREKKRK